MFRARPSRQRKTAHALSGLSVASVLALAPVAATASGASAPAAGATLARAGGESVVGAAREGSPDPSRRAPLVRLREELKDLMLCYGEGTDVIGDSTRDDPLADGKEIYSRCFTEDAEFRVWFPGTPLDGPPTIPPLTGPDAWAEFVFGSFDGTYTFTQHILTNFLFDIRGSEATLTAYLNATHVAQDESGVVTQVDVANGTCRLSIKRVRGRYRVEALDLTLLNFNPFFP